MTEARMGMHILPPNTLKLTAERRFQRKFLCSPHWTHKEYRAFTLRAHLYAPLVPLLFVKLDFPRVLWHNVSCSCMNLTNSLIWGAHIGDKLWEMTHKCAGGNTWCIMKYTRQRLSLHAGTCSSRVWRRSASWDVDAWIWDKWMKALGHLGKQFRSHLRTGLGQPPFELFRSPPRSAPIWKEKR